MSQATCQSFNPIAPPLAHRQPAPDRSRGGVLISMVAVMLILGVLGVSLVTMTQTSTQSEWSTNAGARAHFLAESGLSYAQNIYCTNLDTPDEWRYGTSRTLVLATGEEIEVAWRSINTFTATAIANPGTPLQARARVLAPLSLCGIDPEDIGGPERAILGDTGIDLGTNTIIQGDVEVIDQDITIRGEVIGDVHADNVSMTGGFVDGDIYAQGNVSVGPGTVTGDVHAGGTLTMTSSGAAGSAIFNNVFTVGDIDIRGGAIVQGVVHSCDGSIEIGGNGTSTGSVYASGNVILSGSATVTGVVHAGGYIHISGNAKILGDAYAKESITADDGAITGTQYESYPNPEEPICPNLDDANTSNLPEKTTFTVGTTDYDSNLVGPSYPHELAPGSYRDLDLKKDARLYLRPKSDGHGNYYFQNIDLATEVKLYLDLSTEYDIRIFVSNEVDIKNQFSVFVKSISDGSYYPVIDGVDADGLIISNPNVSAALAAKVYLESHGDFGLQQNSHWFGAVYTPDSMLDIGRSDLIGAFYSGGGHSLGGSTIRHISPNYFKP